MNTREEIVEILNAYREGAVIEIKMPGKTWREIQFRSENGDMFIPDFEKLEYRIKPKPRKPREFYAVEREGGLIRLLCYAEPGCAIKWPVDQAEKVIKLREVIE